MLSYLAYFHFICEMWELIIWPKCGLKVVNLARNRPLLAQFRSISVILRPFETILRSNVGFSS